MGILTNLVGGIVACLAWMLVYFKLIRMFRSVKPGAALGGEFAQMIISVALVALLAASFAWLVVGLDPITPGGTMPAIGAAVVVFITMYIAFGSVMGPKPVQPETADLVHPPKV